MSFDQDLGTRLRTLRQMKRVSQDALGEMLGVTFQQIQKYETGANRICPEKLYQCAQIFGVPVGYFFAQDDNASISNFDKKTLTVAAAIASLPSDEVSKRIYHLVLALQGNDGSYQHCTT